MNGKHIFVGFGEKKREAQKVKEGAVISVKYSGVNAHGTLLQPAFMREREDLFWNDLIAINSASLT